MIKEKEGLILKFYKCERYLYNHRCRVLAKAVYFLIQLLFNCVIPPSVSFGGGCTVAHGVGIVIHHTAVIGNGVKIFQNVTIGQPGVVIGDNCLLGAGAVILGPCTIGNNVKIGANTVVNFDVPDNSTVVGVKGRII